MSKKVDERVVEMRFENGQFEKGVAQSTESLNKLKKSLNLEGAAKGLENVNSAAKNTSGIESLAASLEKVEHRFSTMGIVGMRVIENLTDSAMRFAKKTVGFVTNGIINGGKRRAMNLENANFQLQGLLKNEEIYNIFDTEKFLNRPVMVAVSNTSGLAGIAHWINTYYKLKGDAQVDKNSELVKEIKKWVDEEYAGGRVTVLTDDEIIACLNRVCLEKNIKLGE